MLDIKKLKYNEEIKSAKGPKNGAKNGKKKRRKTKKVSKPKKAKPKIIIDMTRDEGMSFLKKWCCEGESAFKSFHKVAKRGRP